MGQSGRKKEREADGRERGTDGTKGDGKKEVQKKDEGTHGGAF